MEVSNVKTVDDLAKTGLLLEQSCDQLIIEIGKLKKKVKGMVENRRADYLDWLRDEVEHMTYELRQDNNLVKGSVPKDGGNP